ncbi:MAG TPA: hypothetical protein VIB60_05865, partial [Methylomirabilota bacterium]
MDVSSRDGQPVLAALAEAAARLSDATEAVIYRQDGDSLRLVARHGGRRSPSADTKPARAARSTIQGRAILDRVMIRIGALIAAPMLRDGATVGVILVRRGKARPFASA